MISIIWIHRIKTVDKYCCRVVRVTGHVIVLHALLNLLYSFRQTHNGTKMCSKMDIQGLWFGYNCYPISFYMTFGLNSSPMIFFFKKKVANEWCKFILFNPTFKLIPWTIFSPLSMAPDKSTAFYRPSYRYSPLYKCTRLKIIVSVEFPTCICTRSIIKSI